MWAMPGVSGEARRAVRRRVDRMCASARASAHSRELVWTKRSASSVGLGRVRAWSCRCLTSSRRRALAWRRRFEGGAVVGHDAFDLDAEASKVGARALKRKRQAGGSLLGPAGFPDERAANGRSIAGCTYSQPTTATLLWPVSCTVIRWYNTIETAEELVDVNVDNLARQQHHFITTRDSAQPSSNTNSPS